MAKDYGMRGEAAGRLSKGKRKPEEDELGLPPEEEAGAMPPGEEAGGAPDLAALLGGGGDPGMAPEEGMMPPGGPEGEMMPPEPVDLDTALGGVEGALEGLPPEAAEEIRIHLNAIREIAARTGSEGAQPPMGATPAAPELGAAPGGEQPPIPEV